MEKRVLFCQILRGATSDYRTLISFALFLGKYIFLCALVYWPLTAVCVFLCVISQSTSKKPYVSDCSKLDTLLHKTHQGPFVTKVLRLHMCRSIISSSKIAQQMGNDHLFSQRNKTEKAVGFWVGGTTTGMVRKNLKKKKRG